MPAAVYVNAMPSTYATDNMNERRVDTFWPPPAMIPDRIGTIGNTQGVNASPRPAAKDSNSTRARLPFLISSAKLSCSETYSPLEGAVESATVVSPVPSSETLISFVVGG